MVIFIQNFRFNKFSFLNKISFQTTSNFQSLGYNYFKIKTKGNFSLSFFQTLNRKNFSSNPKIDPSSLLNEKVQNIVLGKHYKILEEDIKNSIELFQ